MDPRKKITSVIHTGQNVLNTKSLSAYLLANYERGGVGWGAYVSWATLFMLFPPLTPGPS